MPIVNKRLDSLDETKVVGINVLSFVTPIFWMHDQLLDKNFAFIRFYDLWAKIFDCKFNMLKVYKWNFTLINVLMVSNSQLKVTRFSPETTASRCQCPVRTLNVQILIFSLIFRYLDNFENFIFSFD